MFNIITNHIFQGGNKRTGLEAAFIFLEQNGYFIKQKLEQIKVEGKLIPTNVHRQICDLQSIQHSHHFRFLTHGNGYIVAVFHFDVATFFSNVFLNVFGIN